MTSLTICLLADWLRKKGSVDDWRGCGRQIGVVRVWQTYTTQPVQLKLSKPPA